MEKKQRLAVPALLKYKVAEQALDDCKDTKDHGPDVTTRSSYVHIDSGDLKDLELDLNVFDTTLHQFEYPKFDKKDVINKDIDTYTGSNDDFIHEESRLMAEETSKNLANIMNEY